MALTAELDEQFLVRQIRDRLDQGQVTSHLVRQAVECQVELPASLLTHRDPSLRATAISSGHADHDLEKYLLPNATVQEALAAVARCEGPRLLELLFDDRWQVRAWATDLLVRKGESSIPPLRELASCRESVTGVAAVAALERLGDEDWLRSRLSEWEHAERL